MKKKYKLLLLAAIVPLVLVNVVLAVTLWHIELHWTVESTAITVWKDSECTQTWGNTYEFTFEDVTEKDFLFYVRNDGTVTVDITIVNEAKENCIATWNPESLVGLQVTHVELLNLTLSVTNGSGQYYFDFKSTKTT